MTAVQLKKLVIKKLSNIDDSEFLNAINVIVDSRNKEENLIKLSDIEKKIIRKSKNQIKRGEYISNDKVFKKIDEWLKEK